MSGFQLEERERVTNSLQANAQNLGIFSTGVHMLATI